MTTLISAPLADDCYRSRCLYTVHVQISPALWVVQLRRTDLCLRGLRPGADWQMHMLETATSASTPTSAGGNSFIRHLDEIGVGAVADLAHMVLGAELDELDLLAERGVGIALITPVSNSRSQRRGCFVPEMLAKRREKRRRGHGRPQFSTMIRLSTANCARGDWPTSVLARHRPR
ncbi:MAG: hypothetical protein R2856_08395 [Caldilineaceae bacterium]